MLKFTLVLMAVAAVSVQGQQNQLEAAAQSGRWDEFNKILSQNTGFGNWPIPQLQDIRALKGGPGVQVYGQSQSSFKSSSNINGQRSDYSAGHKLTNDNGRIEEYDFKP